MSCWNQNRCFSNLNIQPMGQWVSIWGLCYPEKMWNCISPSLPSAPERNLAGDYGRQSKACGLCCHKCNSKFHVWPDCPHRRNGEDNGGDNCGNNGGTLGTNSNSNYTPNSNSTAKSNSNSNSNLTVNLAPASIWKHIYSAGQDYVIEVNSVKFKFCAKCWCNCTGKIGLYNRSHTTSEHRGSKFSALDSDFFASENDEVPEMNLASNDDAAALLTLIYPNPGGLVFSDYFWMDDIPGVEHLQVI